LNFATFCYVPKIDRLNYAAFLRNLRAYKTAYPVVLFSDEPEEGWEKIENPSEIKKSGNRVAIQNIAFLHAVRLAEKARLSHFCYLELDCRVGFDNWDYDLFITAANNPDKFCFGTYAVYNRSKFTPAQAESVNKAIWESKSITGFDVPEFTAKADRPLGALFVMGAGAVYQTAICSELFQNYERDMFGKAVKVPAFDLFIGLRCYQLFKERAPNKLGLLFNVFSSYGNKINTEKDRIQMASSGIYAIVHQIKSNNDCL